LTPTPLRSFRMNLRAYLARVAKGEALSLTQYGRAVAEVHPVGTGARLDASGAPVGATQQKPPSAGEPPRTDEAG
jgi:antitoxin (DNA-binding transcriptional repressor) of toxin-antitoxin stability system